MHSRTIGAGGLLQQVDEVLVDLIQLPERASRIKRVGRSVSLCPSVDLDRRTAVSGPGSLSGSFAGWAVVLAKSQRSPPAVLRAGSLQIATLRLCTI